jgi:predicted transcriptional regulator
MSATPEKLNIDDIIASLQTLDNKERARLQAALFDLQNDLDLQEVIKENLDDIKSGRVRSHQAVMNEIRAAL